MGLRRRANAGHGLFRRRIDLAAERVDLVGNILLRRRLQ